MEMLGINLADLPWGWIAAALPVVVCSAAVAYNSGSIVYQMWKYRHIPGPTPSLFTGNIRELLKKGGSHTAITEWTKQYGPVWKLFFLSRMFVVVADADLAHTVMYRYVNHPPFVNPSAKLLRGRHVMLDVTGLVQARDTLWRILRNAWQPAFAPGSLVQYISLMQSHADRLADMMSQGVSNKAKLTNGNANGHAGDGVAGEYVDIHDLLNSMTLEVVGSCAYGVRFNALTSNKAGTADPGTGLDVGPALVKACKDFFRTATFAQGSKWGRISAMTGSWFNPVIGVLARTFPDDPMKRMMSAKDTILNTSSFLIADWRQRHSASGHPHASGNAVPDVKKPAGSMSGVSPGSFLGLLLAAQDKAAKQGSKDKLDDMTITAQANTFILAGTETTANTLSFAVYLLSCNPDKEAALMAEIDAYDWSKPLGLDDKVWQFPYADAVISESLRLIPAAHTTTREVDNKDTTLNGYHVYSGAQLFIPIYAIHHNEQYWPQVEDFIPERWLPSGHKEFGQRNPNAYLPFGAGTRQCIGYKFALQEARIALVTLYRFYTFKVQPEQVPLQLSAGFTLAPKNGLMVQVVPRKKAQ